MTVVHAVAVGVSFHAVAGGRWIESGPLSFLPLPSRGGARCARDACGGDRAGRLTVGPHAVPAALCASGRRFPTAIRPLGARHLRRNRPSGQGRRGYDPALPRLRPRDSRTDSSTLSCGSTSFNGRSGVIREGARKLVAYRSAVRAGDSCGLGLQAPPIGRSGRFAGGRGHRAADARWGSDDPARREARRGRRGAPPGVVPARSRPEASRAEGERWPRRPMGKEERAPARRRHEVDPAVAVQRSTSRLIVPTPSPACAACMPLPCVRFSCASRSFRVSPPESCKIHAPGARSARRVSRPSFVTTPARRSRWRDAWTTVCFPGCRRRQTSWRGRSATGSSSRSWPAPSCSRSWRSTGRGTTSATSAGS